MRFFPLKNSKGVALLVILGLFSLVFPLLQGAWKDSKLDYNFSNLTMNRLQARQNAKSGVKLAILRLSVYKASVQFVESTGLGSSLKPVVDQIWQAPFLWPIPASKDMLESDRQDLENLRTSSFLKGSYALQIEAEDGRLNINDLNSPLSFFIHEALLNLLLQKLSDSEDLRDKYSEDQVLLLVDNLQDFVDEDQDGARGGSEYQGEGVKPLNRSLADISEMRKVPGMTEELFQILEPSVTVYGSLSWNVNYASKDTLRALGLSEDLAQEIRIRTDPSSEYYQPFSSTEEFCELLSGFGSSFCQDFEEDYELSDLFRTGFPLNFRVLSSGEYKSKVVNLEALLYDLGGAAKNWQVAVYNEKKKILEKKGHNFPKSEEEEKPLTGQVKIDYNKLKALTLMYLKEL